MSAEEIAGVYRQNLAVLMFADPANIDAPGDPPAGREHQAGALPQPPVRGNRRPGRRARRRHRAAANHLGHARHHRPALPADAPRHPAPASPRAAGAPDRGRRPLGHVRGGGPVQRRVPRPAAPAGLSCAPSRSEGGAVMPSAVLAANEAALRLCRYRRSCPPRITPPARPLNRLVVRRQFRAQSAAGRAAGRLRAGFRALRRQDPDRLGHGARPDQGRAARPARELPASSCRSAMLGPLLGKGILTSEGNGMEMAAPDVGADVPASRADDVRARPSCGPRAISSQRGAVRPQAPTHEIERDMTKVTFDVISATLLPSADATVGAGHRSARPSCSRRPAPGRCSMPSPTRRSGCPGRGAAASARPSICCAPRWQPCCASGATAPQQRDDLMHRLMTAHDPETGAPMNEEQLIDNLLTFYLAGHDTTAKALTWTLYLLAHSPEWTAVLKDEIARVTGGGAVTAEHIDKLVLTQQVVKESMRLFPPVPMMSRQAVADTALGAARHHGRHLRRHSDLRPPPPQRPLAQPRPVRPHALCARAGGQDLALPVHAVRGGAAHLHRHGLRHDRGHRHAGNDAAVRPLRHRTGPRARCRSRGSRCVPKGGMPLRVWLD